MSRRERSIGIGLTAHNYARPRRPATGAVVTPVRRANLAHHSGGSHGPTRGYVVAEPVKERLARGATLAGGSADRAAQDGELELLVSSPAPGRLHNLSSGSSRVVRNGEVLAGGDG